MNFQEAKELVGHSRLKFGDPEHLAALRTLETVERVKAVIQKFRVIDSTGPKAGAAGGGAGEIRRPKPSSAFANELLRHPAELVDEAMRQLDLTWAVPKAKGSPHEPAA